MQTTGVSEILKNRALAGESRVRILGALRREGRALDAPELSELLSLHASTVRFHLQALEEAGLVERRILRLGRPGRPRVAYVATVSEDPSESARRYELLSQILASSLTGKVEDPRELAREAGQTWGRAIAAEWGLPLGPTAEEALRALAGMLVELGFSPESDPEGPDESAPGSISLHHCPFRKVAKANPDVVCSVHLGLVQGALAEWQAGVRADALEPFAEPGVCRLHFSKQAG
jgi:predicted ArsR family transcriptional regulator